MWVTRGEFARLLGVEREAVMRAVQRGRLRAPAVIQQGDQILVHRDHARTQWAENTWVQTEQTKDHPQHRSIVEEKARKLKADADLAEAKAKKAAGSVIDREAAYRAWYSKLRVIRDRLLELPSRLAPEAVGKDEPAIHALVEREVNELLRSCFRDLRGDP